MLKIPELLKYEVAPVSRTLLANVAVAALLNKPLLLKYEVVPPVSRTLLAKVAVAALLNKPLLLKYEVMPPVNRELLANVTVPAVVNCVAWIDETLNDEA